MDLASTCMIWGGKRIQSFFLGKWMAAVVGKRAKDLSLGALLNPVGITVEEDDGKKKEESCICSLDNPCRGCPMESQRASIRYLLPTGGLHEDASLLSWLHWSFARHAPKGISSQLLTDVGYYVCLCT